MKKILVAIAVVALAAMAAPAFAAMNPFMDVPASHWAYDAVAQLASRGIIGGYPDGTFKGPQPATRYEIASIIARALAFIDMDKADKRDVEMLKRLIVEFSDELHALGVMVEDLDTRLGTLDKDLGGWKLSGNFEFFAKFGRNGQIGGDRPASYYGLDGRNDFDLDLYRIYLEKRINETTRFTSRIGKGVQGGHSNDAPDAVWQHYYVTMTLPYDIELMLGRIEPNWEDAVGLVGDDDAYSLPKQHYGFHFYKDWGMVNLKVLFGRTGDDGVRSLIGFDDATQRYVFSGWSDTAKWEAFLLGAN